MKPAATPQPQDRRTPAPAGRGLAPAVWAVLLACCLPELLLQAADHGWIGSARWRPLAYQYGAFWAGLLHGWRPNFAAQPATMFLSYGFLHSGLGHLVGNVAALLGLGPMVIERFGTRGFVLVWLGALLGGGAGFGLLSGSPAPMVGASGALFGLLGAWIWGLAADRRAAGRSLWPVAGLVAGLALLNLVMWVFLDGLLAWETHLGGFLAGAAIGALLPRARAGR